MAGPGRELHIIGVETQGGSLVAIAPFCIEKNLAFTVLRSIPVHFGDFFEIVAVPGAGYEETINCIIEYLQLYSCWDMVRIDQVNTASTLHTFLGGGGFFHKKTTDIFEIQFEGMGLDEFLGRLSRNRRRIIRKKKRRLERDFAVKLIPETDSSGYLARFDEMRAMYEQRWQDDYVPLLSDSYYKCRNEAVNACFDKGEMLLYVLEADGKIIAYHLGFVHGNCYFTWKESFDNSFAEYSPGALIKIYIIEDLMVKGFSGMNFMAGAYSFKSTLVPDGPRSTNHSVFAFRPGVRGSILQRYHLSWRDIARDCFARVREKKSVSALSRWVLKGTRGR